MRYLFISLLCTRFIAKHMVFTGSENNFWIFENAALFMYFSDIFRQEDSNFSRCFRVGELNYSFHYPTVFLTVNSTKTIVFLVLRIRCQMGKWFVFVAYWCFPVTEDCFERSFPSKTERFLPFSRTENAQKTLENNVSSKKKKKECFLAFFSCLRWENASLSAIHLMQLFPRNFKWLPFDYRAENFFFFLYSSVFYTINHLEIYRYVYCTYMFW